MKKRQEKKWSRGSSFGTAVLGLSPESYSTEPPSDTTRIWIHYALITLLLSLLLCFALHAEARKVQHVAVLSAGSVESHGAYVDAFRNTMKNLGYVEGNNITYEYRWANGRLERLQPMAEELVQLKPDLILASATPAVMAAKNATKTIPIIMGTVTNPVDTGIIESLSHPGGNVTGSANLSGDVIPKMVELLHATAPRANAVFVLVNPSNPIYAGMLKQTLATAEILGIAVSRVDARTPEEIDAAFLAMEESRAGALLVHPDPMFVNQRRRIVKLAERYRIPAMYPYREFVDDGGLMSYGSSLTDTYRRAATYADKILRGARPQDLPVEQPTLFELVLNLKTAQSQGIAIPQSLLFLASDVIK